MAITEEQWKQEVKLVKELLKQKDDVYWVGEQLGKSASWVVTRRYPKRYKLISHTFNKKSTGMKESEFTKKVYDKLKKQGFKKLDRIWGSGKISKIFGKDIENVTKGGFIDLLLQKENVTYFIEVKVKTDSQHIQRGLGQLLVHQAYNGNKNKKYILCMPENLKNTKRVFAFLEATSSGKNIYTSKKPEFFDKVLVDYLKKKNIELWFL